MVNELKFEDIEIYEYRIPFSSPIRPGKNTLETREGFVMRVLDDGLAGYGEIAPLDGFSHETVAGAREQLLQLADKLKGLYVVGEVLHRSADISDAIPVVDLHASVVFGMETAALGLLEAQVKKIFPAMVRRNSLDAVPINGLLNMTRPDASVETEVQRLMERGFKTIKVKVARRTVEEEIRIVNRVSELVPEEINIRLDANRLWDFDTAVHFGKSIPVERIEYIEEPFLDPALIPRFHSTTGLPVGIDESLEHIEFNDFQVPEGVNAFVLKPTFLGGMDRTMRFIELAKQHGLRAVITSCYETGPAFAALLNMASTIEFDNSAYGMDTLKYLESNLFNVPITIENGEISIQHLHDSNVDDIYNMKLLKRIK